MYIQFYIQPSGSDVASLALSRNSQAIGVNINHTIFYLQ